MNFKALHVTTFKISADLIVVNALEKFSLLLSYRMKNSIHFIIALFFLFFSVDNCLAEKYHPNNKGRTWQYSVFTKHKSNSNQGQFSIKSLGTRKINGKETTAFQLNNGTLIFIAEDSKGVYRYAYQTTRDIDPVIDINSEIMFKYPLKIGTSWNDQNTPTLLKDIFFYYKEIEINCEATILTKDAIVTVPKGTFENCLKIKYYGSRDVKNRHTGLLDTYIIEAYEWYAPNVGLVKSIVEQSVNDNTKKSNSVISATRVILLNDFTK